MTIEYCPSEPDSWTWPDAYREPPCPVCGTELDLTQEGPLPA